MTTTRWKCSPTAESREAAKRKAGKCERERERVLLILFLVHIIAP